MAEDIQQKSVESYFVELEVPEEDRVEDQECG